MVDHTISPNFNIHIETNPDKSQQELFNSEDLLIENQHKIVESIIQKMALSVCPPNTELHMVPLSVINEAWKIFNMVSVMGNALAEAKGEFPQSKE